VVWVLLRPGQPAMFSFASLSTQMKQLTHRATCTGPALPCAADTVTPSVNPPCHVGHSAFVTCCEPSSNALKLHGIDVYHSVSSLLHTRRWVREELHRWIYDNLRAKWATVRRCVRGG
jgi:hypothetical protein